MHDQRAAHDVGGKIMALAPLALMSAHPWRRAAFTTYALSLSFFEAVLLDALIRGGGREAFILADVKGVRAALSEQGARRVGKEYEVEPIVIPTGAFHAKVSVLTSDNECHLLVGSGNLTFGGWGGNLEVLEHLHPSFAADGIDDVANFFDQLSQRKQFRHSAQTQSAAIAEDLRASIRGRARNGTIRVLHSLDGAISQSVAQVVDDLGGAVRLVAAAPFWDKGTAIDRLCKALGIDHVFVHAHPGGTVEGTFGSNWPVRTKCAVRAIALDVMREETSRKLHGKIIEVICKRGRILLSGSANMTAAALEANHNVEVCVARIQRGRVKGWTFSASTPPELRLAPDEETEGEDDTSGVLRAILEADQLTGQVLTPAMRGRASAFQLTTEGPVELGLTDVAADGTFRIGTPGLELQSWKGGRLVLRLQTRDGRRSEGFVSVAAFAEISRHAGPMASRLLAVLAGTEVPADVAAIMSWFYEDPGRLIGTRPGHVSGSSSNGGQKVGSDATIAVAELNSTHAVPLSGNRPDAVGSVTWSRFMDFVFAAFRESRGPFGRTGAGRKDDDEEDDGNLEPPTGVAPIDPAVGRSLVVFRKLFDLLLSPENAARHAGTAFDLTQYVCERLQPDVGAVTYWLNTLIEALIRINPPDRRDDVVAAILTSLGANPSLTEFRIARAQLLRLGVSISGDPPSPDRVRGFQSVLAQTESFAALWARLQTVRTFSELAKAYVIDLRKGRPSMDYGHLAQEAPEEWPIMREAFTSDDARERLLVLDKWTTACPRHHMTLPSGEIQKLRTTSIATAKNCCQRVLIYAGE